MSWITVVWSVNAGICLTLAGVQLLVWAKSRDAQANLFFAIAATAASANAFAELALMRAQTPAQFGMLLRDAHVAICMLVISALWFVRFYLQAGRLWLAWLITGMRIVVLVLTFSLHPNLNFLEITDLNQISIWGDSYVVPVGTKNPLANFTHLSGILLFVFVFDAAFSAWRRGGRRRARIIAITFGLAIATAVSSGEIMNRALLPLPLTVSFPFLIILVGITYELSMDLVRARRVAGELRDSQERMRLATNAADVGLWEWDIARDAFWVSDSIRERNRLGATERVDLERILQFVHADDRESVRQAIRDTPKSGRNIEIEYRALTAHGATRWMAARGEVVRGNDGEPVRVRGVSLDITERKRLEQRFRATVEAAPTAMVMIDGEGTIALVNAEAERLFGYGHAEMVGRSVEMLLPERDRAPHARLRASFFASPRARRMGQGRDLFALRKDGSVFPVEIGLAPVQIEEGTFVLSAVADVTQRLADEAKLQEQHAELARVQRASTIGQLANTLAHELSQPLGAILRNAEAGELFLQQESPDTEELRSILADIRRDDQRAAAVIDRIRAMLRRQHPAGGLLSVGELVDQVVGLARAECQARHVVAQVDIGDNLPRALGDPVQVQQVLLNLLVNALDAMDDTAVEQRRLTVAAHRADNQFVEVSVSDSGHGIPDGQEARIFEPLHTTKATGLGIGLAISQTIVETYGGRIWAENNPEGGAKFRFTLKVANSQASK